MLTSGDCECAECARLDASTPDPTNALLGQASAVFEAAGLDSPDTAAELLAMHLRAMCAIIRQIGGYMTHEDQQRLMAAEEACKP